MITAYSYVRFSSKPQERGDSVRRQTTLARKYAEEHRIRLSEESYEDLGISGLEGRNAVEGALGAFLKAVDEGTIKRGSYLLVESLDRISRLQLDEALDLFMSIIRRGITIVTLQDGQVYSSEKIKQDKGISLIISIMVMVRAHEESATKGRRVQEAWQAKRDAGGILTSMGPAWLKHNKVAKKWEVVREKAEIVQRIFTMSASGYGSPTIAEKLNEEGVPRMGRAEFWTASLVARLLENRAVMGEYTPKKAADKTPKAEYYPPIVEPDLFYKVQEGIKSRHKSGGPKGQRVSNLLTGRCYCECGSVMRFVSSTANAVYLQCVKAYSNAGCDAPRMPYNAFEAEVISWIITFGRAGLSDHAQVDPRVAMNGELERKRREMSNLLDLQAASTKPSAPKMLMARIEKLDAEIEQLEAEIQSYIPPTPIGQTRKAALELLERHKQLQDSNGPELFELRLQLQAELRLLVKRVVFRKELKKMGDVLDPLDLPDDNPQGYYREVVIYGPIADESNMYVYGRTTDLPESEFRTSDGGVVHGFYLPPWGINGTRRRQR